MVTNKDQTDQIQTDADAKIKRLNEPQPPQSKDNFQYLLRQQAHQIKTMEIEIKSLHDQIYMLKQYIF